MTGQAQEQPDAAKSAYAAETLREWAERMAVAAAPLRKEQRDIIMDAFNGALEA